MITRKAIIVGNAGGYRGLPHLKGVSSDISNYENFLKTKAGGQWSESEIIKLIDCTAETIITEVKNTIVDYAFITFCGHGLIRTYDKDDYVCVKDMNISVENLISPSRKQTIVIDANLIAHTHLVANINSPLITEADLTDDRSKDTRELFNLSIEDMPAGLLIVYSTHQNELAGSDETLGGHFTYCFIKAGIDWWRERSDGAVLRINGAFDTAQKNMQDIFNSNQHPALGGAARRITFPPFAFSK